MKKQILFYRTNEVPYGPFSNFDTKHPIRMPTTGIWPSTEHAFQAYKFFPTDPEYAEKIRLAPKPRDAAAMGRDRSHPLRPDWESAKDAIMKAVVSAKFTQHEDMKALLLFTGDDELVEHTENDSYWADGGDGSGKNMLGKILMEIREQLRETEKSKKPIYNFGNLVKLEVGEFRLFTSQLCCWNGKEQGDYEKAELDKQIDEILSLCSALGQTSQGYEEDWDHHNKLVGELKILQESVQQALGIRAYENRNQKTE